MAPMTSFIVGPVQEPWLTFEGMRCELRLLVVVGMFSVTYFCFVRRILWESCVADSELCCFVEGVG